DSSRAGPGSRRLGLRWSLYGLGGHRVGLVVGALVRELAAEPADLLERAPYGARPGGLAVGDVVGLAHGPDLGRDLTQAVGRQAREQVVLDLLVEGATEDRDQPGDRVVVGRLDLHGVALALAGRHRALGVVGGVLTDVTADDGQARVHVAQPLG